MRGNSPLRSIPCHVNHHSQAPPIARYSPIQSKRPASESGQGCQGASLLMGETAPSPLRSYQIVWMVRLRMLGLLDHLESWASLPGFRYGITLKVEPLFLGSGMGLPYPSMGSPWKLDLDMMPARRCDFLLCKKKR